MPSKKPHLFDQLYTELRQISRQARWVHSSLSENHRRTLWVAVALMAVAAGANAVVPLLIGSVVDSILRGHIRVFAAALPGLMALAALYGFREVLTVCRRIVVERAATDIEKASLLRAVWTTFRGEYVRRSLDLTSWEAASNTVNEMEREFAFISTFKV